MDAKGKEKEGKKCEPYYWIMSRIVLAMKELKFLNKKEKRLW